MLKESCLRDCVVISRVLADGCEVDSIERINPYLYITFCVMVRDTDSVENICWILGNTMDNLRSKNSTSFT